MSGIFKSLQPKDIRVTPFQANKLIATSFDGNESSSLDGIKVYQSFFATQSSYEFSTPGITNLDQGNTSYDTLFPTTTDGYYQTVIHRQLDSLFYKNYLSNNLTTLGSGNVNFQHRSLGHGAKVISCANRVLGEGIQPGSVQILGSSGAVVIEDDLYGNLILRETPFLGAPTDLADYDNLMYSTDFGQHYQYVNEGPVYVQQSLSYGSHRLQTMFNNVAFEKADVYAKVGLLLNNSSVTLNAVENTATKQIYNFTNKDYSIAFGLKLSHTGSNQTIVSKQKPVDDWKISNTGEVITGTNIPSSFPYKIFVSASSGKLRFEKSDGQSTFTFASSNALTSKNTYYNCVVQRTGSVVELYVNGIKTSATDTFYDASTCNTSDLGCSNSSNLILGNDYTGASPVSGGLSYFHIFNRALTSTEISDLDSTNGTVNRFCGNVFYNLGLIVITNSEALQYQLESLQYKTKSTLLETQIYCTVGPGDFTHTFNKSIEGWNPITNRQEIMCHYTGSNFRPYVTTVGCYDDENNLLVVGKTSTPVQTSKTTDTTFILKFDR